MYMNRKSAWIAGMSAEATEEVHQLGAHLRAARERRGLSASELARRVGVDRRTIARLEGGEPTASIGVLLQALAVLDLARGFAEVIAPEHDHEAALAEVRAIRSRRTRAARIRDDEVDF